MKIDHATFFVGYREVFGRLKQTQVTGIELLGRHMEADDEITDIRQAAYMLATVKHETADTWAPITEYGNRAYFDKYEPGTEIGKRLGNLKKGDGWTYRGRGYVQITGRCNYERLSRVLALPADQNLIDHPDNALIPSIAYRILAVGMRAGLFTGKKLADYVSGDQCDYKNARRIVNGLDQCDLLTDYAERFETVLQHSLLRLSPEHIEATPALRWFVAHKETQPVLEQQYHCFREGREWLEWRPVPLVSDAR